MPPQITYASAVPGKTGNTKIAFFTRCISALPEFNQFCLISSIFLTHDSYLHCCTCLPKSCNQCVQLGAFGGHGSGERKSRTLQ